MPKLIEEVDNNTNNGNKNENNINTVNSTHCAICEIGTGIYSCPKCEILYCSLKCYKHEKHKSCTNEFYSEQIKDNMTSNKTTLEEKQFILDKLKELESDIDNNFKDFENDFDYHSLIDNFEDLNLDTCSFSEIWSLLPQSFQKEFEQKFLDNPDNLTLQAELMNIIPSFKVWWQSEKIQDISESSLDQFSIKIEQFPMFKISRIEDCVKYHIIYTIFIYSILYRYLLGDFNSNSKYFRSLNLQLNPTLNPKSKLELNSIKEFIEFYISLNIEEFDDDFQQSTICQALNDTIAILEEETYIQMLFSHLVQSYRNDDKKFTGFHNINFLYSMAMNINFQLKINSLVEEIQQDLKYYK
ncbi:hypothetical protein CONCODRAFT_14297 [Conidiobolus coronatus NRRL 28638]|uniref:HIT-type domain-containing protein n=1 Tax=Conidiobolus coronatus (strain ATCC 28846 / CBS 209.66 / NRRL 28638) TaxID=796925 RepID=A0A137NP94_CONC2|nr:hypothetical protein CONCODRAFT_14297 [Conidiobolus coronatus NRRL 28638]|eukprot:KXN64558.1 hypothetical protein CONCODRAFT_14297 [Conidiobolus coronatus NRRL 28638]